MPLLMIVTCVAPGPPGVGPSNIAVALTSASTAILWL